MKKKLLVLILVLALTAPLAGLAARSYIIPDSDTRSLTEGELWEWSYESLGFILNEIFARHGFNFIPGEKYYNYFHQRAWYTPNANPNNSEACYPRLSNLEWNNEVLVKKVRQQMRDLRTTNPGGKHYLNYIETGFDVLSGFVITPMKANQKLPVYAAPSVSSYRGASGKAVVSTNGDVFAAGYDQGWLLVMYATNNGAVRVGYVQEAKLKGNTYLPLLSFARQRLSLSRDAFLTDDPATSFTQICALPQGSEVTFLSEFQNRYAWAYVETSVNGQSVRGFVPSDALDRGVMYVQERDTIGEGK